MKRIDIITDDLKYKLLNQSMKFVSENAYNYCEYVYDGDYFYLVKFSNHEDLTLLSKENSWSMIVTIFNCQSKRYLDHKDECVEVIPGFYMFRQEEQESEFSFKKMNYWLNKYISFKRNEKINMILVD